MSDWAVRAQPFTTKSIGPECELGVNRLWKVVSTLAKGGRPDFLVPDVAL